MLAAAKYGRIRALEQQQIATATAKGEEEGVGRVSVSVSVDEAAAVSVDAPLSLPPVTLLPPSDYMERILAVPPTRDFSLHRLRAQLAMLEDESTAS
jgi:predicted nuclease with RNAse H fold